MSRWAVRRSGSHPDGKPKLRFQAWFSWRQDALLKMCQRGELTGRIRVYMLGKNGKEQIDIVGWDEWRLNDDGMLTLEDIRYFDTAPLRETR